MYSIAAFGKMISDKGRTGPYLQALKRAIRPGSVVVDIGAGTGIFSLLACQFGARKVYAIEPGDAISVAEETASLNGLADRIQCIRTLSTETTLPEKADVIISDLHGVLPLFKLHLPSIIDARRRLLMPGGQLIPQQDALWVALVEAPGLFDDIVAPWVPERFNVNMDAAFQLVTNQWSKASVTADQLISKPCHWSTIDYRTIESPNVSGEMKFQPTRDGLAHGFVLWFDTILADGIGFSNAPGQPTLIYGSAYFPWPSAVPLERKDNISVLLRADLVDSDYIWTWETQVYDQDPSRPRVHFRQSTFFGSPLSPVQLRKRGGSYHPSRNEDGEIDVYLLQSMDQTRSNEEIARLLSVRFPLRFSTERQALSRIADLSAKYSQ